MTTLSSSGSGIAIVSPPTYPLPWNWYGAIEKVVMARVRTFRELGFSVTLVAPRGSDPRLATRVIEVPSLRWNLEKLQGAGSVQKLRWLLYSGALNFPFIFASTRVDPTVPVIINDSFRYEPHNALWTSYRFGRTRTINVLHGDFDPERLYLRFVSPFYRTLFLGALNRNLAAELQHRGFRAAYFPNGIDFDPSIAVVSNPNDYFVFVGRISRTKAPHLFVKLARKTGIRLVLIGPIHDSPYFVEMIRPYLSDKIEYVGEVPERVRDDWVRRARGLMYTNARNEPQGLVLQEALRFGVPIIGIPPGRFSGFFDVVRDGKNGIVADSIQKLESRLGEVDGLDRKAIAEQTRRDWEWGSVAKKYYLPFMSEVAERE